MTSGADLEKFLSSWPKCIKAVQLTGTRSEAPRSANQIGWDSRRSFALFYYHGDASS